MAAVRRGVCDVVSCVARVRSRFVSVHTAPRLRGWTFNRVPRRHFRTRDTARARDRLDRCAMIVLARSGISLCATSFYLTRFSGRRPFVRCSAPGSHCALPRAARRHRMWRPRHASHRPLPAVLRTLLRLRPLDQRSLSGGGVRMLTTFACCPTRLQLDYMSAAKPPSPPPPPP